MYITSFVSFGSFGPDVEYSKKKINYTLQWNQRELEAIKTSSVVIANCIRNPATAGIKSDNGIREESIAKAAARFDRKQSSRTAVNGESKARRTSQLALYTSIVFSTILSDGVRAFKMRIVYCFVYACTYSLFRYWNTVGVLCVVFYVYLLALTI